MTDTPNNTHLLELAPQELMIPLKVTHAGRTYRVTHHLRPPAPADWFTYEAALQMAVEELPPDPHSDEPRFRLLMRSSDAALELWDRLALAVTGYSLPGAQQAPPGSTQQAAAPAKGGSAQNTPTSSGEETAAAVSSSAFSIPGRAPQRSGGAEQSAGGRAEPASARTGALAPEVRAQGEAGQTAESWRGGTSRSAAPPEAGQAEFPSPVWDATVQDSSGHGGTCPERSRGSRAENGSNQAGALAPEVGLHREAGQTAEALWGGASRSAAETPPVPSVAEGSVAEGPVPSVAEGSGVEGRSLRGAPPDTMVARRATTQSAGGFVGRPFRADNESVARSATTEGVRGKPPRVPPVLRDEPESAINWRALVPLAHKEAAVRALTLVAPAQLQAESDDPDSTSDQSTDNYFPLHAEQVPVVLEAAVAGRAYPRLVHLFRPPTVADERTYRRLLAETLIVRGSRHPRTLIPARLPALCRLYDSLILGVEGYALEGRPLASSIHAIQSMDPWHKRVAVQALFGDANDSSPATGPSADVGSEELVDP